MSRGAKRVLSAFLSVYILIVYLILMNYLFHFENGYKIWVFKINSFQKWPITGIYSIQTSVLISSCNFDVEKNSLCVYVRYEYTERRHWSRAANCILKYFENMMIDHSDSTIF
jgi:hypothetical protein